MKREEKEKFEEAWLKVRLPVGLVVITLVAIAVGAFTVASFEDFGHSFGKSLFFFVLMASMFSVFSLIIVKSIISSSPSLIESILNKNSGSLAHNGARGLLGLLSKLFNGILGLFSGGIRGFLNRLPIAIEGLFNGLIAGFVNPYRIVYRLVYWEWHGGILISMIAGAFFGTAFALPLCPIGGLLGFLQGLILGDSEVKY